MTVALIVCGGRHWDNQHEVDRRVDAVAAHHTHMTLIEGGAWGADHNAAVWAENRQGGMGPWLEAKPCYVSWVKMKADWENLPKWEAGHERNQRMLDALLDLRDRGVEVAVFAFKEGFDFEMKGGGTEDMARRALSAKVQVLVVQNPEQASILNG